MVSLCFSLLALILDDNFISLSNIEEKKKKKLISLILASLLKRAQHII